MDKVSAEVIFYFLYDVGYSIDISQIIKIFHSSSKNSVPLVKGKDTPLEILVPKPTLILSEHLTLPEGHMFHSIELYGKVYEDGVVSIIARIQIKEIAILNLHMIRTTPFPTPDGAFSVENWVETKFQNILTKIKPTIRSNVYPIDIPEKEAYASFCLTGPEAIIKNPAAFVETYKNYIATLLQGENPAIQLHSSQIQNTLAHPFFFTQQDMIIFDWDRCIIIDPERDYEDILFIIELANYLLLELRTLDKLLDKALDIAEDDIRNAHYHSISNKLKILTRFRYDTLFTLENLENVTKIIGDFYLSELFSHLCNIFRLDEWSKSIRNRLSTLNDIYSIAKQDANERIIIISEILVVALIIFEVIQSFFN